MSQLPTLSTVIHTKPYYEKHYYEENSPSSDLSVSDSSNSSQTHSPTLYPLNKKGDAQAIEAVRPNVKMPFNYNPKPNPTLKSNYEPIEYTNQKQSHPYYHHHNHHHHQQQQKQHHYYYPYYYYSYDQDGHIHHPEAAKYNEYSNQLTPNQSYASVQNHFISHATTPTHQPDSHSTHQKPSSIHKRSKKQTTTNTKNNNISPKATNNTKKSFKGKKKVRIDIPLHELIRCMTLPQVIAAKKLNVSLSTLKRRFYELNISRWPGQSISQWSCNMATQNKDHHQINVDTLQQYHDNIKNEDKAKLNHVLNKYDIYDTCTIDSVSSTILDVAFKQNV